MITLGYWVVRGRGQTLRHLLEYTKASWQETNYLHDEEWFERDKYKLGLHFPNLPYLIDGTTRLTETQAIARYIIQRSDKTDLLGKDVKDRAMVNNVVGVVADINQDISDILYLKDGLSLIGDFRRRTDVRIKNVMKVKGQKKWILPYLTWGDFVTSEISYYIEKIYPDLYKDYGALHQTRQDFNQLPEIKGYYAKENTFKGNFTSKQWANLHF